MSSAFREKLRRAVAGARWRLMDADALAQTLERLSAEGAISGASAAALRARLPGHVERSRYVIGQLGVHLGFAAVFALDFVPLPLGTVSRVAWVAGSRVVEELRGNASRARVHSMAVLLIAAIPFLGYGAYLLPLRRQSTELVFVLANHTWLARTGRTYEQFVASTYPPVRRVARWLVPPLWSESGG